MFDRRIATVVDICPSIPAGFYRGFERPEIFLPSQRLIVIFGLDFRPRLRHMDDSQRGFQRVTDGIKNSVPKLQTPRLRQTNGSPSALPMPQDRLQDVPFRRLANISNDQFPGKPQRIRDVFGGILTDDVDDARPGVDVDGRRDGQSDASQDRRHGDEFRISGFRDESDGIGRQRGRDPSPGIGDDLADAAKAFAG